jgi:hypothetical protein
MISAIGFTIFLCCQLTQAQTEQWIPANPTHVVPDRLAVFNCEGQTTVVAHWIFNDGGYRVTQTPVLARNGQTISLDVRVEEFTGPRIQMLVPFEKNFSIGSLEPGTYTLSFKSWDTILKQIQFTVVETPVTTQPLEKPCFYVAQHYRDFLSREADGSGFAFWTNDLMNCGLDTRCLEVKRINVSAAFFLSLEFKDTGYFVYRIYKASLGRAPTFAEFALDAGQLGKNVIVGPDRAWVTILDGNKTTYTGAFLNRLEFQARYGGLTNSQYVDKLFEIEGITPTAAERSALIDSLDNCSFAIGCPTRATVLRQIVEHPAFERKIFNEAFVTMQYFGYLRRDPDDAGFQFWLSKLNQFNGNFVEAEMVKAFISSDEYRRRF